MLTTVSEAQYTRARCLSVCRVAWQMDKGSTTAHESVNLQRCLERTLLNIGVSSEHAELMARAAIVDGQFTWGAERLPLETAE